MKRKALEEGVVPQVWRQWRCSLGHLALYLARAVPVEWETASSSTPRVNKTWRQWGASCSGAVGNATGLQVH